MTDRVCPYHCSNDFHWEAVPAGTNWALVNLEDESVLCEVQFGSQPMCARPAVVTLTRVDDQWVQDCVSYYCADHMYGRWIEAGHILYWQMVANA